MIATIVLFGIVLFIIFRFLYFIHKTFRYGRRLEYQISYILPIIELFSWIGFFLWCINRIYEANRYNELIGVGVFFIILAIPSYFLLRDFIFGVYLKVQRKIAKGDFIEFDDIEGEILKAGNFNLDIRDKQGDIITIPYSKIGFKVIAKHGNNPHLKKQILTFVFPGQVKINKLVPELKKNLVNTPWVAISQAPFIERIKHEEGKHIVEIVVFTLKNEYAENIKEMVEKTLL
jgi:hypothetical protein